MWCLPPKSLTVLIIVHTLNGPVISYDPVKNAKNLAQGRPSFDEAAGLDFSTACIVLDARKDYGEARYIAYGVLGVRLHVLVFTETPSGIRAISFRKANRREVRRYENSRQ